jgi:Tfp pilus assembly protein PilF
MYRRALELDPGLASANYNVGALLAFEGSHAEAERHLRAAVATKRTAKSLTALGIVLAAQGQLDEAAATLQDAIDTDPEITDAYEHLATIQTIQGKLDAAATSYQQLIRRKPSPGAHRAYAAVLAKQDKADAARKQNALADALEASRGGPGRGAGAAKEFE